jgi:hypothetical protein
MMRISILLFALFAGPGAYAEVFRWVDEDGVVHFSDRPHEGAETVELQQAQTFSAPASSRPRPSTLEEPETGEQEGSEEGYTGLRIVRPGQDEVLWNTGGIVNVQVEAEPQLQTDHSIQLFLDGQPVNGLEGGAKNFQLTDVFRGTHNLRAEIHDTDGKGLFQSVAISFTVQQTSVQNPNNPGVRP